MGLHRNTLGVLFGRAKKRGEQLPAPLFFVGSRNGIAVYDQIEVMAWYLARQIAPRPVRGADKKPRRRAS